MNPTPSRITSIDTYRGFVMFLMLAEVLRLGAVAAANPESAFWKFLALQQSHVEWTGCTLHDLIQPSFSFLVGVALPFSIASRVAKGQAFWRMALHAAWRGFFLVILGVMLRSVGRKQTNWTFEDTLSQIGLGYFFLFLLGFVSARTKWIVFASLVIGYWLLFVAYPTPNAEFDYTKVGVPANYEHHEPGIAAHFNKNSNAAWAFDTWFLNQFSREKVFTHNNGGYSTLSFIPTLATMLLGLIAGTWLQGTGSDWSKVKWFTIAGVLFLVGGYLIGHSGLVPVVKKIWTPSWVLFSGGWCLLLLALLHATTDASGYRGWSFPLQVIGANSIFVYCVSHLIDGFLIGTFKTHFGADVFARIAGKEFEPLMTGIAVLIVFWLMLYWMYRQRIFIRV